MATKKKKSKPRKIAADRSTSKATPQAMGARGKLIAKVGPTSTIWQSNATIKQSGQDAVAACATVETAKNLQVQDELVATSKLDVFFTNVEDVVTTPKEMQDLGVDPLVENRYVLAVPISTTVTSDPTLHDIAVKVKRAKGMSRCSIEVSADPTFATGVKVFPGDGARQTMGPFPPGTYAVRACHTRASERSAFTEPVTVVVK